MADDTARASSGSTSISSPARTAWFTLLGVLAFVAVTLLSITHADILLDSRMIALPVVGVSVPTNLFLVLTPVVVAVLYANLHLYLLKLWQAFRRAPTDAELGEDRSLADHVQPWLVNDYALTLKNGTTPGRPPPHAAAQRHHPVHRLVGAARGARLDVVRGAADPRPAGDPGHPRLHRGLRARRAAQLAARPPLARAAPRPRGPDRHPRRPRRARGLRPRRELGRDAEPGRGLARRPPARPAAPAQLDRENLVGGSVPGALGAAREFRRTWCALADLPAGLCGTVPAATPYETNRVILDRRAYCRRELGIDGARLVQRCDGYFLDLDAFDAAWAEARREKLAGLPRLDLSGRNLAGASAEDVT